MLVIRLARGGRKKYPVYRIVAADSKRAATAKFVAILGHYNPHTKELVLNKDEAKRYIANGAQPSNAVIRIMKKEKIELPDWAQFKTKAPKKSDEPEVVVAPVAEAAPEKAPAAEEVAAVSAPAVEAAAENADAIAEANPQTGSDTITAADEAAQTDK
jgi:small subunit ribosomal protein S16